MRKPAYVTAVLTAAGVLLFLAPTAPAQSTGSTGQSGTGQSGTSQSGTRSTDRTRSDQMGSQSNSSSSSAQTRDEGSSSASRSGNTASGGNLSSADRKFVTEAAQGGMAEVELGRLATEKAATDQVKQFGQKMVDDHSKANDELKDLASRKGITLPTDMDAKDKAIKDRLSKLSPTEFDREYMKVMERDHNKDVAEFRKASERAKDPDIKQWAGKILPTLQEHDRMAHDDYAALTGSSGTSTKSERHHGTSTDTTTTPATGDQQRNPK